MLSERKGKRITMIQVTSELIEKEIARREEEERKTTHLRDT